MRATVYLVFGNFSLMVIRERRRDQAGDKGPGGGEIPLQGPKPGTRSLKVPPRTALLKRDLMSPRQTW